jgi:hypothetical protein
MLNDAALWAKIAEVKGILPGSLGVTIKRNGTTINEYSIVKLVSEHFNTPENELLEPVVAHETPTAWRSGGIIPTKAD